MQGVIKAYDPDTGIGVIVCDSNLEEYELAPDALEGSILRMVRQGQRLLFTLNSNNLAGQLRFGSEDDMSTPDFG